MSQAAQAAPVAAREEVLAWHRRLARWMAGTRPRLSFPDLVWLHYKRQLAVLKESPTLAEDERAYREALAKFEACEGPIVSAYWCLNLPSAVALTARPPRRPLRWLDWIGWPRRLTFHRASDWSTQPSPTASALLHRCDALAVRVGEVLIGTGHQIAMGLVGRSAGNVLSLVDAPTRPERDKDLLAALAREEKRLDETYDYYKDTAIRQTQLVYTAGMLIGVAALVAAVILILQVLNAFADVSWSVTSGVKLSLAEILGVSTAGALGAIVSVVRRVDSDAFAVDFEVGRLLLVGLGMLRPFLGAVFGLALYAAVVSGFLDVFAIPKEATPQFFFLLAIAFLAGFSERFAEDTLLGATKTTTPTKP